MKKHTELLQCGRFYHIYNRGINGEDLFKEEKNYPFLLEKYGKHIQPVAETYAYCFLKNHFHLLVRTRSEAEILANVGRVPIVGRVQNPADVSRTQHPTDVGTVISRSFGNLFNSYSQAINKVYGRTGGLFEEPFRRIPVDSPEYCRWLVRYIHRNAQRHQFVEDFRDYPHSSWNIFFSTSPTKLKRAEVLEWFGGLDAFVQYHLEENPYSSPTKFDMDFDV
ncbi:MAG: hypothetical protein MUC59_03075 [Saprospiraceae bacterium]|nr:hypothetical protein [Saprospiraceae bacterium]